MSFNSKKFIFGIFFPTFLRISTFAVRTFTQYFRTNLFEIPVKWTWNKERKVFHKIRPLRKLSANFTYSTIFKHLSNHTCTVGASREFGVCVPHAWKWMLYKLLCFKYVFSRQSLTRNPCKKKWEGCVIEIFSAKSLNTQNIIKVC